MRSLTWALWEHLSERPEDLSETPEEHKIYGGLAWRGVEPTFWNQLGGTSYSWNHSPSARLGPV